MHVPVKFVTLARTGVLTTKRIESHDGLPVLLMDGKAYGPADRPFGLAALEEYRLHPLSTMSSAEIGMAEQAGFWISVSGA